MEIDYVEKVDPSYRINYTKLIHSKLFEKCFNVDKENFNKEELDDGKIELFVKEKIDQMKSSFQELKKDSLILI